jgi:N6-adenosine-specific RNA methylase IME4
MTKIKINAAFKALIPPLAPEELAQLEANILADGCRDPLVTWNGWLIDGHNRHAICDKHGLPFETVEMEFADDDAAMDWMDANQLGRRNLSPDAFKLALGRRYNRTKKTKAEAGAIGGASKDQIDTCLPSTAAKLATQHSVSEATVKRAGKFAEEVASNPKLQQAIADRTPVLQVKRELKEERREERREENRAKVANVTKPTDVAATGARFATLVIDPPWDWSDEGDQDQLGRARPEYATMTIEKLMELPVADLADDDCHCYLWITNRSLPKGFTLLEKWGFRYITTITWVKPSFGLGNYFRGQTEQILFGVRGSQPLKRKDVGTVLHAPRGPNGHSSKPVESYALIESCSPGPYLEMFSRSDRPNWKTWGENA